MGRCLIRAHPRRLNAAYQTAKEILRRVPNNPEIFEESQIDDLVAQIEDEMRTHGTAD
jgi:hypothetical protein